MYGGEVYNETHNYVHVHVHVLMQYCTFKYMCMYV